MIWYFRNSGKNVSLKAPTTVLIKPDGNTLGAFGYEAEEYYKNLVEEDDHHGYFYFQRFKMLLHGKQVIIDSLTKIITAMF